MSFIYLPVNELAAKKLRKEISFLETLPIKCK